MYMEFGSIVFLAREQNGVCVRVMELFNGHGENVKGCKLGYQTLIASLFDADESDHGPHIDEK